MKATIEELLRNYHCSTAEENRMALREITQSMILIGLSKSGFFETASFYGGTALRIFYGLSRYSEDLDFTLNAKQEDFSLAPYFPTIEEIGRSYGLNFSISQKEKIQKSPVESAFAKLNTYETFINLKMDGGILNLLHKDEAIKVKFEVDTNPALGFLTENKWIDLPEFAPIVTLDMPSLFAGKIHAILCRNYKNRVKGRDYYDFLFYIQKRIKPNMVYLRNKLIESGRLKSDERFDEEILKNLLLDRFTTIDYEEVKREASRFLSHSEDLSYYSKDLFIATLDKI